MIKRSISTLVLSLAVVGILYFFGAHAGVWVIAAIALLSQYEMYRMLERAGCQAIPPVGIAAGAIVLFAPYYLADIPALVPLTTNAATPLAAGSVLVAISVLFLPEEKRVNALAATLLGLLYLPFLLQFFIAILLLPELENDGLLLAFWVVVTVKAADIGAYVSGSFLGRHKLAPSLSPGKSWEGVVGGLLLAALLSFLFVFIFRDSFPAALSPLVAALLALPLGIISVVSDLVESIFKRAAKIKDSGRSIPGIGGSFDLSDSLVLSAPVAFILLSFFYV